MNTIEEKLKAYNEEYKLFCKGDKIVMGVSGGKDSICLLHLLCELKEEYSLSLLIVHINHGIRGVEADEDAKFVEKVANTLGIPFFMKALDVKSFAKKNHISEEEAGREVRYRVMENIREKHGFHKIAIAHHRDDVAETVLFHLLRGTGPKGLAGIVAKRGYLIRPILFASTMEIEDYIYKNKLEYREDYTNKEETYTRNKIRNIIFPLLEKEINVKAKKHASEVAARIALQNEYIEKEAKKAYLRVVRSEKKEYNYQIDEFLELEKVIQIEVIRLILSRLIPSAKNIDQSHYQMIEQLNKKQVGKQINLPNGVIVKRTYNRVYYYIQGEELTKETIKIICSPPCEYIVETEGEMFKIGMKIKLNQNTLHEIPQKDYTKWIDYDKITNDVFLRNPTDGDYFIMDVKGKRKKLSRYYIDKKVPVQKRKSQLVIADGNHVICEMSLGRMSESYKVSDATRKILVITKERLNNE